MLLHTEYPLCGSSAVTIPWALFKTLLAAILSSNNKDATQRSTKGMEEGRSITGCTIMRVYKG